MNKREDGFTVVEGLILTVVLLTIGLVGLIVFGQVNSKEKQAEDATRTEFLTRAKQELNNEVKENKTIPTQLEYTNGINYSRKDNQTAELCASFKLPRNGSSDNNVSPIDVFKSYFMSGNSTQNIYRDNVDFAKHSAGRTCYLINYAPINSAYEERFKGDKKDWHVCDSLRQYDSRYIEQTIKGFKIGGPITVDASDGRSIVLAEDIDAFDEACVKIPINKLNVGDKVELYIETYEHTDTQFVKAIKKNP